MIFLCGSRAPLAANRCNEMEYSGANWIRPDSKKCKSRVVVGQSATLKADHNLVAESNLALAA